MELTLTTNETVKNLEHKFTKANDLIKQTNIALKNLQQSIKENHRELKADLHSVDVKASEASKAHSYSTRHTTKNSVFLPQPQTDHYGKFSIAYQAATTWNDLQNILDIDMLEESNSKVKTALIELCFNSYLN